MQGNHVGLAEQIVKLGDLVRIAQWQLGDHIKKHDAHAQSFSQH